MNLLLWIAAPLLLLGAVMLIADIGAAGLWIAVIAVGLVMVLMGLASRRTRARR
jgi:hypothetical protein